MKIYNLLIFLTFMFFVASSQVTPPAEVQSQGVIGLNFSGPGNSEQISYFIINSNSLSSFSLKLEFANRGNFRSGTSLIPMTSLVLNGLSGTLGEGLSKPVNSDILGFVNGGGEYIWNPGTPTTVTSNYMVELKASWANPSQKLAGLYFETITVTISATGL